MEDNNQDKEVQEGIAQPAAHEESGVTRHQWDGGHWPQVADGVATDEDNHRMLEATANRPKDLTQTQTPDSHWDDVLSRQYAQDAEGVQLERFARNKAVVEQMIKARDDRVNAQKAAAQAREDDFSALASLCYDPTYGQAFVDTGTLQAYNAAHQGEQGFNPITKMGRMNGGALFVERQVVDEKGRPVVEEFIDKKTGQRVQRPKIAIEAIGPKQFQARMKDFVGWEWDGVTKQFMTQSDFAKVQKSREDKARADLYQKQLDADPRLRMADMKLQAELASKVDAHGTGGTGSRDTSSSGGTGAGHGKPPTFDESLKRFEWMKSQLDEMSQGLYDKNGNPTDPDRMKRYEQYKARLERFRDELYGVGDDESKSIEGEVEAPSATPGSSAEQKTSATLRGPLGAEAPEPKIDRRQYQVEALKRLRSRKDAPTYTFADANGEDRTVSFAEAEKMAREGKDAGAREWLGRALNAEAGMMMIDHSLQLDRKRADRKRKLQEASAALYPQGANRSQRMEP